MLETLYSNIIKKNTKTVRAMLLSDPSLANASFAQVASGISALSLACQKRANDIVELLLNNNTTIDVRDRNGKTALYYAVAHFDNNSGGRELLKMVLAKCPDTSLCFEMSLPERPSKDYFCYNCTGVADEGKNDPSKDLINPHKLVVYRKRQLTALEIAQVFNLKEAVELLKGHPLKSSNISSVTKPKSLCFS